MTTNTEREQMHAEALRRYGPVRDYVSMSYQQVVAFEKGALWASDVWRNRQAEAVSEETMRDLEYKLARHRVGPNGANVRNASDVALAEEILTEVSARPVITEEAVIERLASEVDDDCGWLSDAQNARPEWDAGNRSVRFCGEGSIDVGHMVSIVLEAVFGENHQPTEGQENR